MKTSIVLMDNPNILDRAKNLCWYLMKTFIVLMANPIRLDRVRNLCCYRHEEGEEALLISSWRLLLFSAPIPSLWTGCINFVDIVITTIDNDEDFNCFRLDTVKKLSWYRHYSSRLPRWSCVSFRQAFKSVIFRRLLKGIWNQWK